MHTGAAEIFHSHFVSGRHFRVKLLGDSITHGVGGTGFAQDGAKITDGFARNPNGFCYANLFREYMEAHCSCTVVNNACTGTNIEFTIAHFSELVDKEDDIVLCCIGTNNRHQYFCNAPKHTKEEHCSAFYENILQLNRLFEEAGKTVIFIANIPASEANEQDGGDYWRIFHMCDVNDLYQRASDACGFPLISFYDAFLTYCKERNIPYETLLADGLHPNDDGYRVMFTLLLEAIGITEKD